MTRRGLLACFLLFAGVALAEATSLDKIRELRLQGSLREAMELAQNALANTDRAEAIALHLELAKIHDRIGLHTNTRPVAGALRNIRAAEALVDVSDANAEAQVYLAYAEYYYRAETADQGFVQAMHYAGLALEAFEELEDFHGQADAVHRFGLINLQERDLDLALGQFEESLRLDRIAGERPLLRADYERHAGFVHALREDYVESLPFFERSLEYRERAGATDPAMFAAISLAAVLIELDRDEEAVPYLEYARGIAEDIDSGAGRARIADNVAKLRDDLRDDFASANQE